MAGSFLITYLKLMLKVLLLVLFNYNMEYDAQETTNNEVCYCINVEADSLNIYMSDVYSFNCNNSTSDELICEIVKGEAILESKVLVYKIEIPGELIDDDYNMNGIIAFRDDG